MADEVFWLESEPAVEFPALAVGRGTEEERKVVIGAVAIEGGPRRQATACYVQEESAVGCSS